MSTKYRDQQLAYCSQREQQCDQRPLSVSPHRGLQPLATPDGLQPLRGGWHNRDTLTPGGSADSSGPASAPDSVSASTSSCGRSLMVQVCLPFPVMVPFIPCTPRFLKFDIGLCSCSSSLPKLPHWGSTLLGKAYERLQDFSTYSGDFQHSTQQDVHNMFPGAPTCPHAFRAPFGCLCF